MSETAVATPPAPSIPAPSGKSSLGGPQGIRARMAEKGLVPSEKPAPKTEPQPTEVKPSLPIQTARPEAPVTTPKEKEIGTDGMSKEAREQFLKYKESAESSAKRIAELEKFQKDGEMTAKQFKELQQKYAEREKAYEAHEKEIAAVRVQRSAKYRETITEPARKLADGVEDICKSAKLDAAEVFRAINNPNEVEGNTKLAEFLNGMDPLTGEKLKRATNDLRDIVRKADEMEASAPETLSALEAEERREKESQAQRERENYLAAFQQVQDLFMGDTDFAGEKTTREEAEQEFLLPREEVEEAMKLAKEVDISKIDPDHLAGLIQGGYLLFKKNALIANMRKEIASLRTALGRKSGSQPNPSAGATPRRAEGDNVQGRSSGERFRMAFGG